MVGIFCNPAVVAMGEPGIAAAPKNGSDSVFAPVNYKSMQNARFKILGISGVMA
jgi:hypothetical protein